MLLNAPIFILGAHKSGTSLLRSLLDAHQNLLVIPFETHFFSALGGPIQNYFRKSDFTSNMSNEDILRGLTSQIERVNSENNPMADSIMYDRFDIKAFSTQLHQKPYPSDIKGWITKYLQCIVNHLYPDVETSNFRLVEKSVEHCEYAIELFQIFPDCKFIHIVRNPYANIVALRKFKTRTVFPSLPEIIQTLKISHFFLDKNSFYIPDDQYLVVRYEDLLSNPETSMRMIATFLDIPYSNSMLNPTKEGQTWKGNSSSGRALDGIDVERMKAWKSDLTSLECQLVNKVFGSFLERFEYESVYKRNTLIPIKGEGIKTYLRNRAYSYFTNL